MKRVALLTVFFYACTFAAPQRSQASVALAVLGAATVGTAMMSASIGTYYAQNGVLPEYVSSAASSVASAADKIFQPAYLAVGPVSLVTLASFPHAASVYLGQQSAVGATLGDMVDYVKSSASTAYTHFKQLLTESTIPSVFPASSIVPGDSTARLSDGTIVQIIGQPNKTSMNYYTSGFDSYMLSAGAVKLDGFDHTFFMSNKVWWLSNDYCQTYNGKTYYYVWTWAASIGNYPTVNVNPDGSIDYPTLKDKLLAPPAGVASEVPNILKGMPAAQVVKADAVPATSTAATTSPAITQADINNAIKANTAAVAQAAADAAAATAAANPDDAAAQIAAAQAAVEAAKAAEEAAKEEPAEETFSPISDSAFTEPYNPGEFDIPARFTTFLNNVKSSGLFSFSNDFFNSLPGGGSSVYEIEAGRYGHHTIDLSATLSTGLAVLKTILLVCFGFLSIRAVIMKR